MNNQEENLEVDDSEEYEDWQFDYTNDTADNFLNEYLIPELISFDFNNEDENYISGVASFCLFTGLIEILTEHGWSESELVQVVKDFSNQAAFSTIH